jgi:hypothetical protein
MTPSFVAFDPGSPLQHFLAAVRAPFMPTIDVDAALSMLVEEVRTLENINDRLASVAYFMGTGQGLFEFEVFEESPDAPPAEEIREKLVHVSAQLGQAIKNTLMRLNAYRDGISPFTFRSLVNDTTILLARDP